MSFNCLYKRILYVVTIVLLGFAASACSITAPVQEMSNARQSIQAAKDANAERLAADILAAAQKRLQSARHELNTGEYEKARILALEAKHLALKARQLAASKKGN